MTLIKQEVFQTILKQHFIGPDRKPVKLDPIDKYLQVADVIRKTGCPNYKQACIPIVSGLNISVWEGHLQDHFDKFSDSVFEV